MPTDTHLFSFSSKVLHRHQMHLFQVEIVGTNVESNRTWVLCWLHFFIFQNGISTIIVM